MVGAFEDRNIAAGNQVFSSTAQYTAAVAGAQSTMLHYVDILSRCSAYASLRTDPTPSGICDATKRPRVYSTIASGY